MEAHIERILPNGSVTKADPFKVRDPALVAGDRLVLTRAVSTLAKESFQKGDIFELIEKTMDAPLGWRCTAGNWCIKTKYRESGIWSSIEEMYATGILEKVSNPPASISVWDRLNDDEEL